MANPQLRTIMQQGAINCSEQAYEVWQYMNQSGYFQVPAMKKMTINIATIATMKHLILHHPMALIYFSQR
ncbi:spore coat protein [Paenibacillus sp. 2TAB26]|uniref:spore coat protein n=1 Tax=Paenibacillus sp. 2TAB26 TaxID=3233005 RepID=UPI003F955EE6